MIYFSHATHGGEIDMSQKYTKTTRNSLGQFKRSMDRMFHVSAIAQMVDNPLAIAAAKSGKPFMGPKLVPYIQRPGITYKVARGIGA